MSGDGLADELELHANFIVRLVLSGEPPQCMPHPSVTVEGRGMLVQYAIFMLNASFASEASGIALEQLATLALVLDSLQLCFRDGRPDDFSMSMLTTCGRESLTLLSRITCAGVEQGPNAAAVVDALTTSALDLLTTLRMSSTAACAGIIASHLSLLIEVQPPSLRLLQAVRRALEQPPLTTARSSHRHPNQRLCQALLSEGVPRRCLQRVSKIVAIFSISDAGACPPDVCAVFQHVEAIVQKTSNANSAPDLEELRVLRTRCRGSEEKPVEHKASPISQKLRRLQKSIRFSCFAPRCRE